MNGGSTLPSELLRGYRLRAGLSQEQVATRAGLSVRALRNIEQQRTARPRPGSLRRLARALELTAAEQDRLLMLVSDLPDAGPPRVDVLGPLAVWRGASPVRLAGAMCRRMLGVLAVNVGRAVSSDELVDLLWGDRPPRTAANQLHVYVSKVRAALEPGRGAGRSSSALTPVGGGYRLELDSELVDVGRFERLLAEARTLGGTAAIAAYEEALALWRGPVLADGGEPIRQYPAVVALARRRAEAAAEAADVALARDAGGRAVTWLLGVLAEEPLHEGLHARLMLALAAGGEPAAALRHYVTVRRRLAEELGLEPGAELRAAHLAVLRQRPGVGRARADPQVAGRQLVPAQLPRDVPSFVGRATELEVLDGLLCARHVQTSVVSILSGMAGVGKTTLAVHWAHQVAHRFPDGQLYVNLRGFDPDGPATAPLDAVRGFLNGLGVPSVDVPSDAQARISLYRSLVATRRMLVVLDNARDAEQVRPLLPSGPTSATVVTSREELTGLVATDGAHPLTLDALGTSDARQLLVRRLGEDRVGAEPDAIDAIIAACAGLPLALAVAAARARQSGQPLATIAAELGAAGKLLDALDGGDRFSRLRTVFSWSYRALGDPAARLFRLLGLHPGADLDTTAAASLAGMAVERVRRPIAELLRSHLLTETVPGRYGLHDLLRAYAAETAHRDEPAADLRAARQRILDHYLHTAFCAARVLSPQRSPITIPAYRDGVTPEEIADDRQAMAWFDAEHETLLRALEMASDRGFDAHVEPLAWALTDFLQRSGRWQQQAAVHAAALHATGRLADRHAQARAHRHLSRAYILLGRLEDAHIHYLHALDLSRQLHDTNGQGHIHLNVANLLEREGRYAEALHHARQALDLFAALHDKSAHGRTLNMVGWFHARLGDHRPALAYCRRALIILEEIDDRIGQAYTLDSLGYAHHHLSHHTDAIACYRQAVAIYRDLGDRYYEADTLNHLGDAHLAAGDHDAARNAWAQALTILTEIHHADAKGVRGKIRQLDPATGTG